MLDNSTLLEYVLCLTLEIKRNTYYCRPAAIIETTKKKRGYITAPVQINWTVKLCC